MLSSNYKTVIISLVSTAPDALIIETNPRDDIISGVEAIKRVSLLLSWVFHVVQIF
jgi:hypothetical protein